MKGKVFHNPQKNLPPELRYKAVVIVNPSTIFPTFLFCCVSFSFVNTSDIISTIKTIEEKNVCAEYIIRQSQYSTCMCPDLSGPKTTCTKTTGAYVCVLNQSVIFPSFAVVFLCFRFVCYCWL